MNGSLSGFRRLLVRGRTAALAAALVAALRLAAEDPGAGPTTANLEALVQPYLTAGPARAEAAVPTNSAGLYFVPSPASDTDGVQRGAN